MRKHLSKIFLLTAALCLLLAGCGQSGQNAETLPENSTEQSEQAEQPAQAPTGEAEGDEPAAPEETPETDEQTYTDNFSVDQAAAEAFASLAKERGFGAIIAAAGKAAHLAGVLAAYTTLPVIGVPIKTSMMGGLDSLLSMVQMPKGIPVACVAVDGADNAAILAAQMLALSDGELGDKLEQFKASMAAEVEQKDRKIQGEAL